MLKNNIIKMINRYYYINKRFFHPKTYIPIILSTKEKLITKPLKIEDIYNSKMNISIWSYNIKKDIFEAKTAKIIKTYPKKMIKLKFMDHGKIICDKNRLFLTDEYLYDNIDNLNRKNLISFTAANIHMFDYDFGVSWAPTENLEYIYTGKNAIIKKKDLDKEYDSYDLIVDDAENYVILTNSFIRDHKYFMNEFLHNGVIIKNKDTKITGIKNED